MFRQVAPSLPYLHFTSRRWPDIVEQPHQTAALKSVAQIFDIAGATLNVVRTYVD